MSHDTYAERTLAPFVPTPQVVVDAALDMLELSSKDTFLDLGCGDGRTVTEALARGAHESIGIDIDPRCADSAKKRIKALPLDEIGRARIVSGDFTEENEENQRLLLAASAIFIFLSPTGASQLTERLSQFQPRLQPNLRVLSVDFPLENSPLVLRKEVSVMGLDLHLYGNGEDAAGR